MAGIAYALLIVGGIGSLICWIMVLIRMFSTAGALHGILGIICPLYAFIWGWIKSGEQGLQKLMLGWTGCVALNIVGNIVMAASAR